MADWPFPLDAIQGWFEDLWNSIYKWISDSVNLIWEKVSGGLDWLWRAIFDKFSLVWEWISDHINWLWGKIADKFTWLVEALKGSFQWVVSSLNNVIKGVKDAVLSGITWVKGIFVTWFQWTQELIVSKVSWLRDIVNNSISWVKGIIVTWFQWTQKLITDKVNWVTSEIGGYLTLAVGTIAGYVGDAISGISKLMAESVKLWIAWIREAFVPWALDTIKWLQTEVLVPGTNAIMPLIEDILKAFRGVMKGLIESIVPTGPRTPIKAFSQMPDVILGTFALGSEISTILTLLQIKVLGSGLDLGPFVSMVAPFIPSGLLVSAFIGTAVQIGYVAPLEYYYNSQYVPLIPGAQDLIRFVVREVIKPDDFTKYMTWHGYSTAWGKAYWEAHWVLPGFRDLQTAMWRGIIKEDQFKSYIILHDYKPEPRKNGWVGDQALMGALAYNLPGRFESRWMVEQGVIAGEEHRNLTRARGMHPDWIAKVALAEERAGVRAELEAVIREQMAMVTEGYKDFDWFKTQVSSIGLPPRLTSFWVSRARAQYHRKLWIDRKNALFSAYQYDRITRDTLDAQLKAAAINDFTRMYEIQTVDIKKAGQTEPDTDAIEAKITAIDRQIAEAKRLIEKRQAEVREAEILRKETIEVLNLEIKQLGERITQTKARILIPVGAEEIRARLIDLDERIRAAERDIRDKTNEVKEAELLKRETLDVADLQIELLRSEIDEARAKAAVPVGAERIREQLIDIEVKIRTATRALSDAKSSLAEAQRLREESLDVFDLQIRWLKADIVKLT